MWGQSVQPPTDSARQYQDSFIARRIESGEMLTREEILIFRQLNPFSLNVDDLENMSGDLFRVCGDSYSIICKMNTVGRQQPASK
jgi:hypothetical protein